MFRDSASEPQQYRPERLHQQEGMLMMLLSLLQDKATLLPLNQATACLPVTVMVSKHDCHDRRTDQHHRLLPDKPDIARSLNCSHSKAVFTRATFGLFVARQRDWRRRPTVTRHPNRCRGGCRSKWNMSHSFLRSDTVIYEGATQRPVDELVPTFRLVCRHSSVCQFPASLYIGHLRTSPSLSQRSLTGTTVV